MVFVATPTLNPSPQGGGRRWKRRASDQIRREKQALPSPLRGGIEGGGSKGPETTSSGGVELRRLVPSEIEANWLQLATLLAPAITHDKRRTLADVYTDLIARRLHGLTIEDNGTRGLAILEFGTATNGASCCWVVYVAGRISAAPRRWRKSARDLMRHFESLARACGATEMRVEGRNWANILTDYAALSDRPGRNELRKVL